MTENNPLPKAILFDYGSVIEGPLDEEGFEADLAALAQEHGFESGRDLWHHFYICDAWERAKRGQITRDAYWVDRLNALGINDAEAQGQFKQRMHRNRGLRPEMRDLLIELKQHYRLAVVSNTSRRDLGVYLAEHRGLVDLFDVVVSSAEAGVAKPEPAIYHLALDALGIAPHEALFVDDLERNTTAAEALGIPSIIFTTAAALRKELERRGVISGLSAEA
jgi:epoxide hydrolase-like predicted phosphatase